MRTLLLLIILLVAGAWFYPPYAEGTENACSALEKKMSILAQAEAHQSTASRTVMLSLPRATVERDGVAVLYISHRLEEVKAVADVVTVLRDGRWVATKPAAELQPVDMARLMVGRELSQLYPPRAAALSRPAGPRPPRASPP